MNIWFLAAGAASFALCLLHIFGGGAVAARPLLATNALDRVAKYTNYYCWHMVTIIIAAMGLMYIYASIFVEAVELAWVASLLALGFSIWNLALYFWQRKTFRHWYELAQWLFFTPIWLLGFTGLI
ncbi:MAG: hypothetical protein L3J65_07595 [Robiginitomaculum sp.]|nr:hypothetical protein [Robiginitomaculum sp.]